jgi:excisionase family DNA binding protein
MTDKLVLTVSEVAQMLGLSRNSAYQGVMKGEIPSVRVGKRILVPRIALEKMLESAGK